MSHLLVRRMRCVGQFFLDADGRAFAKALTDGTIVTLVPEPENVHDPLAIRCFVGDQPIGYVPAEFAPTVHLMIEAGKTLTAKVDTYATKGQRNPLLTITVDEGE